MKSIYLAIFRVFSRSLNIPSRQISRRQAHRSVVLFEKLETDDQDATRLSRQLQFKLTLEKNSQNEKKTQSKNFAHLSENQGCEPDLNDICNFAKFMEFYHIYGTFPDSWNLTPCFLNKAQFSRFMELSKIQVHGTFQNQDSRNFFEIRGTFQS